ncbi:MAG TPA: tRNA 2-selenouridine(34) synthase MnmH, partial [Cupriavidus sp.]|nr:tRNA 2-selenouridine(34) synthase MnmH [Cupriavidus sp.]
ARSQRKHFHKWEARRVVHADSLSALGIEALATSIVQTVAEQQPA